MSADKLFTRELAQIKVQEWQKAGLKVGFTSGVFDILHAGHVTYLAEAKKKCDRLIVAVNSDSSVRGNKGNLRPIISEEDRAQIIAALASVDAVFIFSENNNNNNILILKPDIYLKASDYSAEKLTSASIVESYGGKLELLNFVDGRSTSSIINDILEKYAHVYHREVPKEVLENKNKDVESKIAFLDRDGTLIKHYEYLAEPEKVEILPGVMKGLKYLQAEGYKLVIITNQPGIGLGYMQREDFYRVNLKMFKLLSAEGILIDKIYFCPHSKSEKCECRKPDLALFERAKKDFPNFNAAKSLMFGDTTADIQFAKNAGLKAVLVETGYAGKDEQFKIEADFKISNFAEVRSVCSKPE